MCMHFIECSSAINLVLPKELSQANRLHVLSVCVPLANCGAPCSTCLLPPPQGIIGEGYGRMLAGAPQEPDDFKFHGDNSDYLMDSYFSAGHTNDVFGLATASGGGMSRKRRLVERVQVAFPLAFSSTGAARPHAAAGAAAAATNHRPRRALVETTAAPAKATARRPFFGSALTLRSLPLLGFTQ